MKADGPIRVRLTAEERSWLVARLYVDVLWDLTNQHLDERSDVDLLLESGPLALRRRFIARADLEAAQALLDKLDWPEGRTYAEASLMYECGADLEESMS